MGGRRRCPCRPGLRIAPRRGTTRGGARERREGRGQGGILTPGEAGHTDDQDRDPDHARKSAQKRHYQQSHPSWKNRDGSKVPKIRIPPNLSIGQDADRLEAGRADFADRHGFMGRAARLVSSRDGPPGRRWRSIVRGLAKEYDPRWFEACPGTAVGVGSPPVLSRSPRECAAITQLRPGFLDFPESRIRRPSSLH